MKERSMMHRDLKPANIFLGEQGQVKLGDLGLGRTFTSRTLETTTCVGTPYYMAPEVMTNVPYSYPADVWSLGCVIYELANMVSPFYERNLDLYQLYTKIQKGRYAPVDAGYSEALRSLVHAMVSVDPAARPTLEQAIAVSSTALA
mmetsp:Transcript_42054/g.112555  ORF Transcript_42054/g.112555 Transcript_42054/m.112555 type:complete len:146 (-) Transcript_42054:60-497(-)